MGLSFRPSVLIEGDTAIRSVHLDGICVRCLEERAGAVHHSQGQPAGCYRGSRGQWRLLDHAIVLDRRSAGDGNGESAPTHLQVTGRA
jgi:hypothetical protein